MISILIAAAMVGSPIVKANEICATSIASPVGYLATQGDVPFKVGSPEYFEYINYRMSRLRSSWKVRASQEGLDPLMVSAICEGQLLSYIQGMRAQLSSVHVALPKN